MASTINYLLFYLSALFSISTPFISDRTTIEIELNKKTVQVEYIGLKTTEKENATIKNAFKELNEAANFSNYASQFRLISNKFYKKGNKLNAKLIFSYNNQGDLAHLLFHTESNGNILYPILVDEKITKSNGKKVTIKGHDAIQWDKNIETIKISLKRMEFGENEINLVKYFKK